MDEEEERVEVVVPDEQLSLAIGRRGQNVRLASQLTGWQIDIMTESQESERRQREFAERTALFQEALDVDEVIAQLLVTEGFVSVEDVAYVEADEIAAIEGFDEDTAEEIQARARDYLDREAAEFDAKRRELGVEDAVLDVDGVTLPIAVALGEGDVKTVEDLAGLVPDDIRGWYEHKAGERVREKGILEAFNMSPEDAERLVMRARVAAGWIEPEAEEPEADVEEDRRSTKPRRCSANVSEPSDQNQPARTPATLAELSRQRRDVVSGVSMEESRLIRFVETPDSSIVADLGRKLPGRGVWVAADRASIARARQQGLFSRALRKKVQVALNIERSGRSPVNARPSAFLARFGKEGRVNW